MLLGPRAHLRYEPPTKTSTAVVGMNVDLFKVSCVGLEYLDVCERSFNSASSDFTEWQYSIQCEIQDRLE